MSLLIYVYITLQRFKLTIIKLEININKIYFQNGRDKEIVGNLVGVPRYQEGAAN